MVYSVIQHPFSAASGSKLVNFQIVDDVAGKAKPVAFLVPADGGHASAQEVEILANNIKEFLNKDHMAQYFGKPGRTLHYYPVHQGLMFQFHQRGDEPHMSTVSVDAILFKAMPEYSDMLADMISARLDEFNKVVMLSGCRQEQRAKVREHGATKHPAGIPTVMKPL